MSKTILSLIKNILFLLPAFLAIPSVVGAQDMQQYGPYEIRYKTIASAAIHQQMDLYSPIIRHLPAGTNGIALRWCLPEFPFGAFMRAPKAEKQQMLNARVCEVVINGQRFYIAGSGIVPDL